MTVLVTGIGGFLGGHLAARLLAAGHHVRGTVRDMHRADRLRAALAPFGPDGQLDLVRLDLTEDAGWPEAMSGVRYLLHAASPLPLHEPADREALIGPAVSGTRRAVNAALAAKVERIVLTSSVAAIAYGHPPGRQTPYGPGDWTRLSGPPINAYTESKTRSEALAWELMAAAGRRNALVAINPGVILGPLLYPEVPASLELLRRLLEGRVPVLARLPLLVADLADVVDLHLLALTTPEVGGRRLPIATGSYTLPELVAALRPLAGPAADRLPRLVLPDWLARLLAALHPDLRGRLDTLGERRTLDSSAATALLGRPLRPLDQTLGEAAASLAAHDLLAPKKGARPNRATWL